MRRRVLLIFIAMWISKKEVEAECVCVYTNGVVGGKQDKDGMRGGCAVVQGRMSRYPCAASSRRPRETRWLESGRADCCCGPCVNGSFLSFSLLCSMLWDITDWRRDAIKAILIKRKVSRTGVLSIYTLHSTIFAWLKTWAGTNRVNIDSANKQSNTLIWAIAILNSAFATS
jgi:hypothetical protein